MEKFKLKAKAPEGYFNILQTAQYLGVSTRTVRRYIKERNLPASKPAGMLLINKNKLEKWIKENGR